MPSLDIFWISNLHLVKFIEALKNIKFYTYSVPSRNKKKPHIAVELLLSSGNSPEASGEPMTLITKKAPHYCGAFTSSGNRSTKFKTTQNTSKQNMFLNV